MHNCCVAHPFPRKIGQAARASCRLSEDEVGMGLLGGFLVVSFVVRVLVFMFVFGFPGLKLMVVASFVQVQQHTKPR